jgi:hypothetical protein
MALRTWSTRKFEPGREHARIAPAVHAAHPILGSVAYLH